MQALKFALLEGFRLHGNRQRHVHPNNPKRCGRRKKEIKSILGWRKIEEEKIQDARTDIDRRVSNLTFTFLWTWLIKSTHTAHRTSQRDSLPGDDKMCIGRKWSLRLYSLLPATENVKDKRCCFISVWSPTSHAHRVLLLVISGETFQCVCVWSLLKYSTHKLPVSFVCGWKYGVTIETNSCVSLAGYT